MILKKAQVKKKISINQYEVIVDQKDMLIMFIPKKFLMNYIKIENGDTVYIILDSNSSNEGKLAMKYDFMNHPDLLLQKEELDKKDTSKPT